MRKEKLRRIDTTPKPKPKPKPKKKTKMELFEDSLEKFDTSIKAKIRREIRICFRDSTVLKLLMDNQERLLTLNHKKQFYMAEKRFKVMENKLEKILKRNEIIEETLCNVLLAIRQNEYLQAYYPETVGHHAMNVVGQHPEEIARRIKA